MNTGTITLTVVYGPLRGRSYTFEDGQEYLIGRAKDCDLRLPTDMDHAAVSRHHCVLEFDWPVAKVRDLGSRNGTFLNGDNIGQRSSDDFMEDSDLMRPETHYVHDGDKIRIGHTLFRVHFDMSHVDADALMAALTYVG